MNRNLALAFFLSFIPGAGFLYMDRKMRGALYGLSFFGAIAGGTLLALLSHEEEFIVLGLLAAAFIFFIQMIDMVVFLLKRGTVTQAINEEGHIVQQSSESERFFSLLLGLIPGVGHFHLGLLNRGLAFLVAFFGTIMMVFFIVFMTGQPGFMIFLGIGIIIWIFNLFDVVQLLKRKEAGEVLKDRTVLEDLEEHRDSEKKSRAITMMLSILPGIGHMYLGLQRRGFQLMAAFILSIYLIDFMRLSLFMFFIPLIWFFSFFDAMQKAADYSEGELKDVPIVTYFVNKQKWIGVGLILLGCYYLFDRILLPEVVPMLSKMLNVDIYHIYYQYFQTAIICLIFIGGGIKLMFGSRKKGDDRP